MCYQVLAGVYLLHCLVFLRLEGLKWQDDWLTVICK